MKFFFKILLLILVAFAVVGCESNNAGKTFTEMTLQPWAQSSKTESITPNDADKPKLVDVKVSKIIDGLSP